VNFSHALDLNNAGQVVGASQTPTSGTWFRGFLWEHGAMSNIGTLGGPTNTWARDINEAGQIAGESGTIFLVARAFLWDTGAMIDLGTLGGNHSSARALNDARQIVGYSLTAGGELHAFLWENGVIRDLGTLGGTYSEATEINEVGQIIGSSVPAAGGDTHGFFWENGVMTDLGTLGGASSHPHDINEAGLVVGQSRTAGNGPFHAILWESGFLMDLGTLGGTGALSGSGSVAAALNEMNQIVGTAMTAAEESHATLWRPLTPVETIETIIAALDALKTDGSLNTGQAKSLINRLNLVTAMLNDGRTTAAVHLLESFIREVQAFVNAGVLTAEQGQPLIDAAQELIDNLP
jgi:probable HAF family extracellular repeat protein